MLTRCCDTAEVADLRLLLLSLMVARISTVLPSRWFLQKSAFLSMTSKIAEALICIGKYTFILIYMSNV